MNYTQAQIDRANAVSLEDFLRTQGETLIKSGREYRWKEHDSLTVRGNKWFRHSQSKGGYPIDFVMEFYGKSFPEAVQLLTGESGEGQTEASTAPPTAFHLPLHNRTADRAIQYLCESRGYRPTASPHSLSRFTPHFGYTLDCQSAGSKNCIQTSWPCANLYHHEHLRPRPPRKRP